MRHCLPGDEHAPPPFTGHPSLRHSHTGCGVQLGTGPAGVTHEVILQRHDVVGP